MVQPGFVLKLKAFVLPMRGKKQEGNKEAGMRAEQFYRLFLF
jgi:hypothetical protein